MSSINVASQILRKPGAREGEPVVTWRFSEALAKLLVLVIMGNGLIANYAPQLGVNMGTLCIDGLTFILFFGALLSNALPRQGDKVLIPNCCRLIFVAFLIIAALTLCSIMVVGVYLPGLLSDLRVRLLYYLIIPALYILLSPASSERVVRFFVNCGVASCLFAVAQSVFAPFLDANLLSVNYDGVLGVGWVEGQGLALRSNALMGNSIEFGGVCVILFCLALADLFNRGLTPIRILKLVAIAAGCYFSYSRVAFAGMAFCFVLLFFMLDRARGTNKVLKFVVVAVVLAVGVLALLGDSVLIARFFGGDSFAQMSNDAHGGNIVRALEVIEENFLFGTGLGTQIVSDSRALADGWWLQLACETGLAVFILYFFAYVSGFRYLVGVYMTTSGFLRELAAVCVVSCIFFFLASFVNSSFAGRADLSLLCVLIGCFGASCCSVDCPENKREARG